MPQETYSGQHDTPKKFRLIGWSEPTGPERHVLSPPSTSRHLPTTVPLKLIYPGMETQESPNGESMLLRTTRLPPIQ